MKVKIILIISTFFVAANIIFAQPPLTTDKNPLIVIPGVMGSTLKNSETDENVWVRFSDAKDDSLKLPINPNLSLNRDKIVADDIVDKVKVLKFLPSISVYDELLKYLDTTGSYKRGDWDKPEITSYKDTYFVFAYDWRRDNAENAKLLIQKVERLKAKLAKPNLKFDILAHSMGGIVARYAAMYGTQEPQAKPVPNWYGAKHFNKIVMLATPNEGSMLSLDTFYNGYSINTIAGKYYPSFLSREVGFSLPALFQLLPHGKSAKFYDEDLKPMPLDIYSIETWREYGWSYLEDKKLTKKMPAAKRVQAEKYLAATLAYTKKFHEALDVKTVVPKSIEFYAFGSECKQTLGGAIIYYDKQKDVWKTLTRGDSYKTSDGEKISDKLVEEKIFEIGDGTVTKSSFLAESIAKINGQDLFGFEPLSINKKLVCEAHVTIPSNKEIQADFMLAFTSKKVDF
jgi:pimeloyl-ACP methyl ester carboxylesterase